MSLIDRDKHFRLRAVSGLILGAPIQAVLAWIAKRVHAVQRNRRRRRELDRLLKLGDEQLRDIGVERRHMEDERRALGWAAHEAAQPDGADSLEISRRFLLR